jgi:hypothetical protein
MNCMRRGPRGKTCGGRIEVRTDRIGRVHFDCPRCARRLAGLCAACPRPVRGKLGRAEFCEACYVTRGKAKARLRKKAWRREYRELVPAIPLAEAGRRAGIARAKNLSPERRAEIARLGGQAKWARVRARAA